MPGEECGPQCQLSPVSPPIHTGAWQCSCWHRRPSDCLCSSSPCALHAALGPTVRCAGLGMFTGLMRSHSRHLDDSTSGPSPIINTVKSPPFGREGYVSRPQVGCYKRPSWRQASYRGSYGHRDLTLTQLSNTVRIQRDFRVPGPLKNRPFIFH